MREIKTIVSDGVTFPIALVVSTFNEPITSALKKGALDRLTELGFKSEDITLVEVPGAVEIPFVAQLLAKKQKVEVIVALGAVIRGETSHYDYVCDQVSQGCQRVMLDYNIPVIFGVLTTENDEQALARVGGTHGHKGRDAIDCAVSMRSIKQQLQ
ncbi:TPA: 6,7-dimethyl-8-ribityllumazine synthase [Legionella pneumophila subsp. pneumophila]|uniref:6,7-dimethyl-8-ribityllumazine synthase n=1 Tax=Legionella pneumophila (strain Lens) TaxID=297245 RepID=Q5WXA9_LEGPL|nr:6,7-dimethyl-8-ribityllumazine synthase [Legionella pneumophila]AOW52215.1 6,7-dimethyl-8-ribityllumazine synthase [Legionella pneumophila subsp. pneumophila]AOW54196.1 6,7-dimethyl-8-ribityllumazine synthase [Legionella pneumophila subsp. pneumophila]AOW57513.1 6,7-dimethyl-8-ribityllumazine synthase [Legionella pneumophila subsp. pneumophila]AOW62309.1 6,7-dimethyl-8-ribityllumazine synthase [Legionella pneumophila subsp. pneumophila]AOW63010.1 6,7-dimethyl-8-ribityllumazine synthase [Leg